MNLKHNPKSKKMSLMLWICFGFLFAFKGVEGGVDQQHVEENALVSVNCNEDNSATFFWIRLKANGQGFEYIGTYSGSKRSGTAADPQKFTVKEKSLELKQFNKEKDSGTYSCVSINNNKMKFSCITKLLGKPVPATIKPKIPTTTLQPVTSATTTPVPCKPNTKERTSGHINVLLGCEQKIFIPLAVGCGVLLLLLLITIIYCNRIRTRRCPHHYKRQPRSRPAGHKTLPNPPDY